MSINLLTQKLMRLWRNFTLIVKAYILFPRRTVSTSCNGYLAEFRNLNITTVNLNELLFKSPVIKPKVNDYVIRIEMRLQGTLDVCFAFEDFNTAKTRRTISSKSKRLLTSSALY
jgi:hypothetical protein